MHIGEFFKIDHSEQCDMKHTTRGNNGNHRKDSLFAVSASLAMHIGIAIILTTATAISSSFTLWQDPVLHVSLVSATSPPSNAKDLSEVAIPVKKPVNEKEKIIEPQVMVKPIEKKDKATAEAVTHRVVGMQSIKPMVASLSRPASLGTNNESVTFKNKGYGNSSVSGISLAVPRYRENAHPAYPLIARMRGYEGIVLLSAEISADGRVGGLRVKKSSGYAMLDRSAIESVKQWRFEPGRKMGKPAAMWVDVPVKFILRDNEEM